MKFYKGWEYYTRTKLFIEISKVQMFFLQGEWQSWEIWTYLKSQKVDCAQLKQARPIIRALKSGKDSNMTTSVIFGQVDVFSMNYVH